MADFESRWKGEIQANYQKWKVAYLEFISIFLNFLYVSEHVFAMSMQLPHVVAPCVVAPLHALLFSGLHGVHHMPDG